VFKRWNSSPIAPRLEVSAARSASRSKSARAAEMSSSRSGAFFADCSGLHQLQFRYLLFLAHLVEDRGDGLMLIRVLCEGQIQGDPLALPLYLCQGCSFCRDHLVIAILVSIPFRELTQPLLELAPETRGQ
jgi:hypothetical protein